MTEKEYQEIREQIFFLKQILDFHNQQAEQGRFLYGMTKEESLEHRLDAMEEIANLEIKLRENQQEDEFSEPNSWASSSICCPYYPRRKTGFFATQLEALANFAPDEQIAHLKAIKTYAVELSSKIQQEKTSTLVA